MKKYNRITAGLKHGYRSGLEDKVAEQLRKAGVEFQYESIKLEYISPETSHKYTPDFVLSTGIIVETKGRFLTADRMKHLLIKKQMPRMDIRFVFTNSKAKISKTSKTSYADWCTKNGFMYADKLIPSEWLS